MKKKKGENQVEFEQIIERGCGIDVHKKKLVATIRGTGIKERTRTFSCFTETIESLKSWLEDNQITHVAMESTGVYWKPVYNILEDHFEVMLVNARHIKNVPGHKTDKKDSKWIAKLLVSGLLRGSFIPPKPIRELRDLTRTRKKIVNQITSDKNRIQSILESANIKLSCVVSDMSGAVATKIIDEMISGEDRVEELVKYRHGSMKASKEELAASLRGYLTDHHRFLLTLTKDSISEKELLLERVDERIDEYLKQQEIELDVELLQKIPGVGRESAIAIVSEIGTDMDRFPDEKHLSSWAGMSPGSNESAGKKKSSRTTHGNSYLSSMLNQCGWAASRTKGTYLRSKYDRLAARRGKKRAITALGHKILIAAYFILKDKTAYKELGYEHLTQLNKAQKIRRHLKQLKELGVHVEIKNDDGREEIIQIPKPPTSDPLRT